MYTRIWYSFGMDVQFVKHSFYVQKCRQFFIGKVNNINFIFQEEDE